MDAVCMILLAYGLYDSIVGVVFVLFMIYLSVCTFSLYIKLKMESKQRTGVEQYQLTSMIIAPNQQLQVSTGYPQVLTNQQPQAQGLIEYPQAPAYQNPQAQGLIEYPQAPAYQHPQAQGLIEYPQAPSYHQQVQGLNGNSQVPDYQKSWVFKTNRSVHQQLSHIISQINLESLF